MEQRSMQGLIDRIKSMQTKETMVLAYGSAVKAISTFSPKGVAPCINMGLRYRLSRHFVVVDTPEPYTSMTCSKCHCRCGPFEALETECRVKLSRKGQLRGRNKNKRKRVITRSEGFTVAKTSNAKPSCTVIATRPSTSLQTSAGCTVGKLRFESPQWMQYKTNDRDWSALTSLARLYRRCNPLKRP
jgi:hypothetical protein